MESIHFRRGFSLIELLVVLAIIAVITTVTITSQTNFNKTLILANSAYDVALTIRSAQTYGMGSRVQAGAASNAGYGVYFSTPLPSSSFKFYADIDPGPSTNSATNCHPALAVTGISAPDAQPGNCTYTTADSLVSTYTLGNRIAVSDFCAFRNGTWKCANSLNHDLSSLDIVFARPNPSPFMTANGSYSPSSVTSSCIVLTSPQGGFRYIAVQPSGEITVATTTCP